MKIALITFNNPTVDWNYGPKFSIEYTADSLRENLKQLLNLEVDYYLFWDNKQYKLPSEIQLNETIKSKGDLWHIGTKLGLDSYPHNLDYVMPTSMINVKVSEAFDHTSWKLSFKGLLMKKRVLDLVPLSSYSNSLDVIGLDFGFKAVKFGVITRYSYLLSNHIKGQIDTIEIDSKDEFFFIYDNFDKKAFIWTYLMCFFKVSPRVFFGALKIKKTKGFNHQYFHSTPNTTSFKKDYKVSIVIATLERYPVLINELKQLQQLYPKPLEIIIVDQTPKEIRDSSFLSLFSKVPIRYFESDIIGQCSSRNIGISKAKGDLLWFLDDDMDEIPKDYLKSHFKMLELFDADASCGVPYEIGTDEIDRSKELIEISNVFPMGDVVVKKEVLVQINGFDTKMDQKKCEDQEIGLRLTKKGHLLLKNNTLRIVHLRASRGGLRKHNVRKITFASSRKKIFNKSILHHSEIYLNLKHFSKQQVYNLMKLNIRGTFILHGPIWKKALKILYAFFSLPLTIRALFISYRKAKSMF